MEPSVTKEGIEPAEILLSVRSLENDTKNLKLADDITITETPIFNDITLKIDNLEDEKIFDTFEEKSANENGEKIPETVENDIELHNMESKHLKSDENQIEFKETEHENIENLNTMKDKDKNQTSDQAAYKNEQDLKLVDLESDTICSIVPTADFFFPRTDSYHPVLDAAPYFGPPPVYETPTEEIKNTFFNK